MREEIKRNGSERMRKGQRGCGQTEDEEGDKGKKQRGNKEE